MEETEGTKEQDGGARGGDREQNKGPGTQSSNKRREITKEDAEMRVMKKFNVGITNPASVGHGWNSGKDRKETKVPPPPFQDRGRGEELLWGDSPADKLGS